MTTPLPPAKPKSAPGATFTPAYGVNVPSIMLMGPSGTGKTDSIITLLEHGLKVFVLSTEGNGVEILLDSFYRRQRKNPNLSIEGLHWKQILPAQMDFKTLLAKARISGTMGVGAMQQLEQGLERNKYPQFMNLIRAMNDLHCERTGKSYGNVAQLDDSWAFVVDSMTGVNVMVSQHVKGHRPTMTQPEYGVVQEHIKDLVNIWTSLPCFFVLTAHVERETNEITGQERIMASTVGKKLAPVLPPYFSEIVYTYRRGEDFFWSTSESNVEVKHRALRPDGKLDPDFGPIVEAYRRRKQEAKGGEQPEPDSN